MELYCETCGELICNKCALKGGKHFNHDYNELNVAFKEYKEEITSSLEPMEKQVMSIKKALALIEQCRGEISSQRAAIEDNIHVSFKQLREVLTVKETELIGQLHKTTQGKLKGLAAQRDQIEITLAQLDSCLHFMRESIKAGNESNVLMMKTSLTHQVKELTTPFQEDTLKPNTEADSIFSLSRLDCNVSELWAGICIRFARSLEMSHHRQGFRGGSSREEVYSYSTCC